jgi:hypothetical protein
MAAQPHGPWGCPALPCCVPGLCREGADPDPGPVSALLGRAGYDLRLAAQLLMCTRHGAVVDVPVRAAAPLPLSIARAAQPSRPALP